MDKSGNSTAWSTTEAGQNLQARLTNERTLMSLDGLLSKIDSLEKAVGNLATIVQQASGMVAMAGDIADETYREAAEKGINIEDRLKNALSIAEKLTAPTMVEKIDGLIKMSDQAPGIMAMTMDMADEAYRKAASNGIEIEERLKNVAILAEKLTTPAMVEKLDSLIKMSDQLPGLLAMTMDIVDEGMKNALESDFDFPALTNLAKDSTQALTAAKAEPPAKVGGIFSILRLLKDKDRQKGLGFLMNFLKHLGQKI